jgi:ketosteroid isomerase-like protein
LAPLTEEEIVRAAIDAFNRRDADGLAAFTDPDVEFHVDPKVLEADVYRGADAVGGYFRRFLGSFDDYEARLEDVRARGPEVVATLHQRARGSASGAEVEMSAIWVFTVRDGKIVRIRTYFDEAEALRAAGLDP